MSFTQHLSREGLETFLRNEGREQEKAAASLHLSYCPICRELRDQLALMHTINQMRTDYERFGLLETQHIEETVFRDLWSGELKDKAQLDQISGHCVVCERCHEKRHDAYLTIKGESNRRKRAVVGVSFLALLVAGSTRRRIGAVLTVLLVATAGFFFGRKTSSPPTADHKNLSSQLQNTKVTGETIPEPKAERHRYPQDKVPRTAKLRRKVLKSQPPSALLVSVQKLNLRELTEDYDLRGAEDTQDEALPFRIIPARNRYTKLDIQLPESSKSGLYFVQIQKAVDLGPIVGNSATSVDGLDLQVSLDLRSVPADGYVICITREDKQDRDAEYLGHYPVVIGKPEDNVKEVTR